MADPPILSLRDARVVFGDREIFSDVEVYLSRGDRICLVGRNGSGKSTLMKTLVGEIELDQGQRYAEPGLRVGYLEQEPRFENQETVFTFVGGGRLDDHLVASILTRLDLDGDRLMETLSGGERRRAGLARTFADPPDVMLLDEPTNHLDLSTIEWLEKQLLAYKGAMLVVSHDRAFLTRITNRIFWLDRKHLRASEQGFGHFDAWVERVLEDEAKAAARLDTKLAQEARWLLRGVTARRRRNQGRLAKLETMRAQRAAMLQGRNRIETKLEEGEIKSKMVIDAHDISKHFNVDDSGGGDVADHDAPRRPERRTIVSGFSTRIMRGDRIGILGPNGAGKTTLLRMLIGESKPDSGRIRVSKHLTTAYFDQHRSDLTPSKTVQDILCPGGGDIVSVLGKPKHVRAYLKDFLFDPAQAESPVSSLSGGERNRLLLSRILTRPSDLLVLDEPTNDLDIETLDLLQGLLADYAGTLILVSHDRDFLDRTVTSTIAMEGDGRAEEFPGGYSDYVRQRKQRDPSRTSKKHKQTARSAPKTGDKPPRARAHLSYKEQRELDGLPNHIKEIEAIIAKLEEALANPDLYGRDPEAFRQAGIALTERKQALEAAEDRWLTLEARREELAQPQQTGTGS